MPHEQNKHAVIYCRVSSAAQTKRGDGLSSQETRCMELARMRGYTVVATFKDDLSGGLVNRPGMNAMISHLKSHKNNPHIVLIDDISRLARGVQTHIELRAAVSDAGGILESPNMEFNDDADGELNEFVQATVAQWQRRKNAEQTIARMRARVMNGYSISKARGYVWKKSKEHGGHILVRDEPIASIIQEALEGYASGRFQLQVEVKRFFEAQPVFPKMRNGTVSNQTVTDILKRVLYAGFVESPNWGVSLRKGHHEPLISFETHHKIQERLAGNAKAPARKDISADFPLRGFVVCGDCGTPMTACWSKGSHARYPYYLCPKKGCESYRKSIRKEKLEGDFKALLRQMQPTKELFAVAQAMFKDLWNHRMTMGQKQAQSLKTKLQQMDRKIEQLLDRIVDAESASVIGAYENRINKLEQNKIVVSEKIAQCGRPVRSFDETVRTAMDFLANPCNLWDSDRLEDKHAVLKLAFADRLEYVRNEGVRTVKTSLPFKVLGEFALPQTKMARPARFERATAWFVARYSIQLSYGRFI